jgi:UDP-N-acetylmuramate dehydrogenase
MAGHKGKLSYAVCLATHVSWKVGGVANRCYQPASLEDLSDFLSQLLTEEPLLWLGLGSNTLVRTKGFAGTVLLLKGGVLGRIQPLDSVRLRVEAGVPCPVLARFCARKALTGLEFLAGIPGTIGGALAMNAGAHGHEIWDFVVQVETMNRRGELSTHPRADYSISYRSVSKTPHEYFIAAEFLLQADLTRVCWERIQAILAHRTRTQPNKPSAGSVFRNPPGCYAGQLIEQCGLKGMQIGGAMVSEKHANFIINRGGATSEDIETIIDILKNAVLEKYGISLELEVHIY